MIDPKTFITGDKQMEPLPELVEMQGTYSCPEQGCFEVAAEGLWNEADRKITWVCPSGHEGSARL